MCTSWSAGARGFDALRGRSKSGASKADSVILHCDNPCILTSCAYRPVALPRKPSAVENRAFAPAWLNGIINSVLVITPWSFPDNYRLSAV